MTKKRYKKAGQKSISKKHQVPKVNRRISRDLQMQI